MAKMTVEFTSTSNTLDEDRLYGTVLGQDEKQHKATIQLSKDQVSDLEHSITYGQVFSVEGEYEARGVSHRDVITDAAMTRLPEKDLQPITGSVVGVKEKEYGARKYDVIGIKTGEVVETSVNQVTGEEVHETKDVISWVNMNKGISRGVQRGDKVTTWPRKSQSGNLWVSDSFGFVNESAKERHKEAAKDARGEVTSPEPTKATKKKEK